MPPTISVSPSCAPVMDALPVRDCRNLANLVVASSITSSGNLPRNLRNVLISLAAGNASILPTSAPLKVAALRTSSLVPAALARSEASPAPIASAPNPATTGAAGPATAAGNKAPIEPNACPKPADMLPSSPPSPFIELAKDCIFSRLANSASSSARALTPKAADSNAPTKPA